MTEKAPQVSVIIAAFRAARTLPRAVVSALAQKDIDVEVIIVDDASPDDTLDCANRLAADPRVRVLGQTTNAGPAAARNRALQNARAPWIAVLDADDVMLPDRLSKLETLARSANADIVLGNLTEISLQSGQVPDDDADAATVDNSGAARPFLTQPDHPLRWDINAYIRGNFESGDHKTFGYLKPLLSREFLVRHSISYNETLRNGEDFHLILACYAAGAVVWFSPDPDYIYIRTARSLSHRANPAHMKALVRADRASASALSDPVARTLMARRIRQIEQLGVAETVIAALRDRHPGAAFAALCRHPAALPRLMRQLSEAVRKRIQP